MTVGKGKKTLVFFTQKIAVVSIIRIFVSPFANNASREYRSFAFNLSPERRLFASRYT
jgi:hypothetical protein